MEMPLLLRKENEAQEKGKKKETRPGPANYFQAPWRKNWGKKVSEGEEKQKNNKKRGEERESRIARPSLFRVFDHGGKEGRELKKRRRKRGREKNASVAQLSYSLDSIDPGKKKIKERKRGKLAAPARGQTLSLFQLHAAREGRKGKRKEGKRGGEW